MAFMRNILRHACAALLPSPGFPHSLVRNLLDLGLRRDDAPLADIGAGTHSTGEEGTKGPSPPPFQSPAAAVEAPEEVAAGYAMPAAHMEEDPEWRQPQRPQKSRGRTGFGKGKSSKGTYQGAGPSKQPGAWVGAGVEGAPLTIIRVLATKSHYQDMQSGRDGDAVGEGTEEAQPAPDVKVGSVERAQEREGHGEGAPGSSAEHSSF